MSRIKDVAEAATSRKQRSDVRNQNFKVSPAAIYLNISQKQDKDDSEPRTDA